MEYLRRKPMPFKVRKKIFIRDKQHCVKCGSEVAIFAKYFGDPNVAEIDHVIPRSKGGSDLEDNLQLLCLLCNRRKYNHEVV